MNKQDLIYKKIRQRVVNKMFSYTNDSDYIDDVTQYIIEVVKMGELLEALKFISLAKMWDSDESHITDSNSSVYWRDKVTVLINKAEDALLELYADEK